MAAPRPRNPAAPRLGATEARQSRPAPGAVIVLAVSTVAGLIMVALVWAFFAGPLHHASNRPQAQSPNEARAFHQGTPMAKVTAPSEGETPDHGGTGQPQGGGAAPR
jgi:hypothetical protein